MTNNIKKARIDAGLSQKQVSLELKVSAPTVCEWEKGKKHPNSDNLRKLATLYNVSVDFLLGISDAPETKKNDAIADIILRLRSDEHFMQVVESLASLSEDQLSAVQTFLSAFKQ